MLFEVETFTGSRSATPDVGSNSLSFQEIWESLAPGEDVSGPVESDLASSGIFQGSMDDAVRRLQRLHGLGTGMSMNVTDASTLPYIGMKIPFCHFGVISDYSCSYFRRRIENIVLLCTGRITAAY